MSRWIANLPAKQVVYFAACEIVYRGLISIGCPLEVLGRHFGILAGYAFKSKDYESTGTPLLRNVNVKPDRIDWTDKVCLPNDKAKDFNRFRLSKGDLVLSMDGTVNKQGIKIAFLSDRDVPALLLQRVCRFDPENAVETRFLYHVLHTTDFLDHLDESNRSIAIPHVSPGQLKSFAIPVLTDAMQKPICDFLDAVRSGVPVSEWPTLPRQLAGQRRVVARIAELAAQIQEIHGTRNDEEKQINQMLSAAFWSIARNAPRAAMRTVAPLVRRSVEVSESMQYPELGIRSFGNGTFHKPALAGFELGSKRIFQLKAGDLLFSNVFAWEGAIAVAKTDDDGRFGSHRFMSCVPKPDVATSRFLCFYFLTNEGIELIRAASPGGAGRNRTLGIEALANVQVPVPPIEKQHWFDKLQTEVDALKRLQAETAVELDALLPAVLDKAFKGDL